MFQFITACIAGLCFAITGCGVSQNQQSVVNRDHPTEAAEADVRTFCGACHVTPLPEMFPKAKWYAEVQRGYEFYYQTGRQDLKLPIQAEVVEYFRQRAPMQLDLVDSENSTPSPIKFRSQPLVLNAATAKPAISFAAWTTDGQDRGRLRVSDMGSGEICFLEPASTFIKPLKNPSVNPATTCICNLDGNGTPDLIISELGSFFPEDHHRGKVIWMPDAFQNGQGIAKTILDNVGRVADVRAADFDGDGDEDLVVAEFGWHRTGGIHVLWNDRLDTKTGERRFRDEKIDTRSGTIHVPPVDLNGDGRTDFIALISQEFEVVVAFLNLPDGFQKRTLFAAPDPSFGSSGIEVIDFDRDGDLDVLYTNGDTFDSSVLKPCHSIKWFENEGTFPFTVHDVAAMPGVHRARAADIDGDGDLDIVTAAMVPKKLFKRGATAPLDAIVWFEQTHPNTFERHVLKTGTPIHTTVEVADMDDDGDIDIAAGCFYFEPSDDHPDVIMFWNDGPTGVASIRSEPR